MRSTLRVLLPVLLLSAASQSTAMGFGRSTPSATLGRPLDFVVSLRLEPGELLNSECVSAEVAAGETVLPRFMVSALLETEAAASQIRVRTQVAIDEPVVSITVTAGCEARVSRRFTLFADPPGMGMRSDAVAWPPPVVAAPVVPGPTAAPPAAPAAEPARTAAASPGPGASAALPPGGAASRAEPQPPARPRAAVQAPRPAPTAGAERPRLKLDAPTISAVAPAAVAEREAAVRAAEAAASAAQAAASAAATRLAAMEKELATLRKEAQAQRQATEHLARVLAQTEEQGRWVPLLLAALVGLAVVVAWLAWRLKKAQDARDSAWWSQQSAMPSTVAPAPTDKALALGEEQPDTAPAALSGRHEEEGGSAADVAASATQAPAAVRGPRALAPAGVAAADGPARDVSIEELLDLEQQAEFFVVLGEEEAAIDLLVTHLRSTGGTVPLPYLKLMEIYRRRGDQASYERTRDRFNQRFSAMAPEWGADLNDGRTLEDYPVVMAHIERVWARPVDAMAILETLLFRTDTGAVFDLPAYREVLFLYTLARDLHERSAQKSAHVDVLLPLADGSGYFATTPRPHLGDRSVPRRVDVDIPVEPQPTAPVDLEVHPLDASGSTSQVGFFDLTTPAPPGEKREK